MFEQYRMKTSFQYRIYINWKLTMNAVWKVSGSTQWVWPKTVCKFNCFFFSNSLKRSIHRPHVTIIIFLGLVVLIIFQKYFHNFSSLWKGMPRGFTDPIRNGYSSHCLFLENIDRSIIFANSPNRVIFTSFGEFAVNFHLRKWAMMVFYDLSRGSVKPDWVHPEDPPKSTFTT